MDFNNFLKELLGIREDPINGACYFLLFYGKLKQYCEEEGLDTKKELRKILKKGGDEIHEE